MNSDYDVIDQFREFALNDQGIELPENIIADGKLHRFKIDGDKGGKLSGAYKLHLDGRPAGFVMNFKTDAKSNWKYTDPNYKKEPVTPEKIKADAERKIEYARKAEQASKADIENKAQAAIRARQEWNNTKASDHNPYAERKGIQLHNARISEYKGEQQLIIPLQDKTGKLVSLQRIKEKVKEDGVMDSAKMLFKDAQKQGAFSVLNKQQDPQVIAIAEGFATTASVIEDRYSVKNNVMGVMAVDAGNLKLVAEAMRELHPNAEILVFGDMGDFNDKGEKAAIEAARAVNGYSVMPPIAKGDFNDYLTGKTGDITVSLENLINQSMGKIMAAEAMYYDKTQSFNAGEEAYSGKSVDYKIEDLPMALEQPHRHDNIINKEQFMLGFMENATEEDGFKSVEEAFKTRLPHLNADEYLNIALETVDRASGSDWYSILPKLPLRDSLENSEIKFDVSTYNNSPAETFNNASEAMERAVEIKADAIIVKEQGQFTTEAHRNADDEFIMPEGESFSKKYTVNTVENTTVAEQVIEPVVTENIQDQSTPSVEQTEPETAQPIPETIDVDSNYSDYVDEQFPPSSYDDFEPYYSTMPQDIDYEAYYAEQAQALTELTTDIQHAESRMEHESDYYYQVEDTGVKTLHAIDAQESAIESNAETINHMNSNDEVVDIFHKEGDEFIKENSENHATRSLTETQDEADFIHAAYIDKRAEQNLTLDRKTTVYPELDVKLAVVDSKEFFFIKGDEYKVQAQQSIAMNAAISKDYANALPEEIIAKPSMKVQPEQPEVTPVAPTSATPANAEKVDISKPDIKVVEPEQKPEPPKLIPKEVADKYLQVDDKFYFRKNKDVVIFEDKGAKLETKLNSPSVAVDLVRIAAERNWKEIKITGTPEFKSEVWMEAESRGIATTGYKPTDIDKAMLKERLAKNPTNTIKEVQVTEKTNTGVRQMLDDSVDKKLAEQHLQSHPKLKETFEYLEALKNQLAKNGTTESQIKIYMDTTKEGMAQMIEAGKYPEFQKVEHQQDTRQDKPEPQKTEAQAQKEVVVTKTKSKDRDMVME